MNEFKLGTYIRKRREELKISQEDLCEGLCAVSTLSRIENNQQDPSRSLTVHLLERLGLSTDRFTALWDQRNITIGALVREIQIDMIRCEQARKEDRAQIQAAVREKLAELEQMAGPDDRIIRQFLLAIQARLGRPEGPYSFEEKLAKQLEAIRLTCPKFDPEDLRHGHYSMDESKLINQIARTYSDAGQRRRAIDIYRQLLWYIEKYDRELAGYAGHFCLVAHNYSIDLGLEQRYQEAIEIAEEGRKICIRYGEYQFLPGFLAVQAECHYFLGNKEKSKKLYYQAHCIYDAFEDEIDKAIMEREMKEHLGIEMPKCLL